jgi:hypothetical protein
VLRWAAVGAYCTFCAVLLDIPANESTNNPSGGVLRRTKQQKLNMLHAGVIAVSEFRGRKGRVAIWGRQ